MDVAELYLLPPAEFTAARDAAVTAARADGDKDAAALLKALRRPSASAWLVNRLVAGDGASVESLLALGPELAKAQSGGDATALRALSARRRELVEAVTDAAVQGQDATATVRSEVAATLEAALADPGSAQAVRSGRLVRALAYAGFGPVDLDGAVADAPAKPTPKPKATRQPDDQAAKRERQKAIAAAEQACQQAAGALDDAVRAAGLFEREAQQAVVAERDAAARAKRAVRTVDMAQQAAEQARERLDALRRT